MSYCQYAEYNNNNNNISINRINMFNDPYYNIENTSIGSYKNIEKMSNNIEYIHNNYDSINKSHDLKGVLSFFPSIINIFDIIPNYYPPLIQLVKLLIDLGNILNNYKVSIPSNIDRSIYYINLEKELSYKIILSIINYYNNKPPSNYSAYTQYSFDHTQLKSLLIIPPNTNPIIHLTKLHSWLDKQLMDYKLPPPPKEIDRSLYIINLHNQLSDIILEFIKNNESSIVKLLEPEGPLLQPP